jgi:hypothetical protein
MLRDGVARESVAKLTTCCACAVERVGEAELDALLRHRLQRPAQPPGELAVRQRAQQSDFVPQPAIPGRVRGTQLFALLPHGAYRPARATRHLLRHLAEQGRVFRRPQRPVVAEDRFAVGRKIVPRLG